MYVVVKGDTTGLNIILHYMGFDYSEENQCWFDCEMPEWKFEIIYPELMKFKGIEVEYES